MKTEDYVPSLLTTTSLEGRQLAITLARKSVHAIQPDPEIKKRLRKQYAEDPGHLILSAQVIATEFQTIAAANNYWRHEK